MVLATNFPTQSWLLTRKRVLFFWVYLSPLLNKVCLFLKLLKSMCYLISFLKFFCLQLFSRVVAQSFQVCRAAAGSAARAWGLTCSTARRARAASCCCRRPRSGSRPMLALLSYWHFLRCSLSVKISDEGIIYVILFLCET